MRRPQAVAVFYMKICVYRHEYERAVLFVYLARHYLLPWFMAVEWLAEVCNCCFLQRQFYIRQSDHLSCFIFARLTGQKNAKNLTF